MPIYNTKGKLLGPHSYFANCCGATYSVVKTKARFNGLLSKGIRVLDGIHGKEGEDRWGVKITHVKTRNGDITVAVQKGVDSNVFG